MHRFAVGAILLPVLLGCAAIHHADRQVKDFTGKLFNRRDPDRAAKGKRRASPAVSKPLAAADPEPDTRARADDSDESDEPSPAASAAAETLFDKGHEAMAERDYDTACARFRESDRLDPAVGAKLNLANCEQERGRYATAWQLFRLALSQLPVSDDRAPIARDHIKQLEPQIPKLTFQLAPHLPPSGRGDITVKGGGAMFRFASFGIPLPFDPGKHRFVVEAPGHRPRTYDVEIEPSENRVLTIEPGPRGKPGR